MLYEEFKKRLVADIREEFSDYTVEETTVTKSNENTLDGVLIKINDTVGPCMYIQHVYDDMINNSLDYEEVLSKVISKYRDSMEELPDIEDLKATILSWESAKTLLRARPIIKAENETFIGDKPYKNYLDFAIVYFLDLGDGNLVHVPNGLLECWGVDRDTVHETAMNNMEGIHYRIRDLGKLFGDNQMKSKFLCLTNDSVFGANSMLINKELDKCATKLGSDNLIVIPSSTHEVLVLSRDDVEDLSSLKNTLKAMNCTLEDSEVLSNHLYYYDRNMGELYF